MKADTKCLIHLNDCSVMIFFKAPGDPLLTADMDTCSEALAQLDDVIMHTFQQCVYHLTKVQYKNKAKSVPNPYILILNSMLIFYLSLHRVLAGTTYILCKKINILYIFNQPQLSQRQQNIFLKTQYIFLISKMFLELSHHHLQFILFFSSCEQLLCFLCAERIVCITSIFENRTYSFCMQFQCSSFRLLFYVNALHTLKTKISKYCFEVEGSMDLGLAYMSTATLEASMRTIKMLA